MADHSQNSKASRSSNRPKKVFRINRIEIGINVIAQIFLVVAIIGMINYFAFLHYTRWDFSRDQRFTLSEQSQKAAKNVRGKLNFIIFFSQESLIYNDVVNLLKEYQYAASKKVNIEFIDQYKNFSRARELQAQYKFGAEENIVIVENQGRFKFVSASDMADIDESGVDFGEPPVVRSFKAESAITSAILEISQEKKNQIYFLSGHGEPEVGENSPISMTKQFIERQFFEVNALDLSQHDQVPEDADLLILVSPAYDLSDQEIEKLTTYWENKGRLLLLLNPTAATPRLANFLNQTGIQPRNDRVLTTVGMDNLTAIILDVTIGFLPGSPVTKNLQNVTSLFTGATQSLEILPETLDKKKIQLIPLIQAGDEFWGEFEYNREEVIFEPNRDTPSPVIVAVSLEKGGLEDDRVHVNSSRMVVVGASEFLLDASLNQPNLDFALNAINWLTDREKLIGITPKEKSMFILTLPERDVQRIGYAVIGGIPAIFALWGLLVWVRRRK